MCGICGIIQDSSSLVEKKQLSTMLNLLTERGPDSRNMFLYKNIGLGHSRLSIIDLDNRSNQPFNGSNNNTLVFNGEIYNFLKIKKELEENDISFKTTSDTEVILEAYQFWGIEKTLDKLDGMFAFAIYNSKMNNLVLARDRFGKKPLYYLHKNKSFYFSSDIRSIWAINKNLLTIDWQSIDYYFSELTMPQPNTIWKEIKQIEPAHYSILNLQTNTLNSSKYWKLPKTNSQELSKKEINAKTEILLQKAIDKRLISDVPLGFFLSGGIDSGLIVALAAQASSKPIKTFTVSVDNAEMNESKDAERVAKRYGTEHYNIHVTADLIENITSLIKYTGEPFADSSLIPTYLITKAIKEQVTVAISGDGGDELFGGYKEYGLAHRTDLFNEKWSNSVLKNPVIWTDKLISRATKKENLGALQHYNTIKDGNRLFRHMAFENKDKISLYNNSSLIQSLGFTEAYWKHIWGSSKNNSLTDKLMSASLETRLLNDYLVKIDRGSMINSVEVRSPFLDKELAEFAFSFNSKHKFSTNENKIILRQLAEKHLGLESSTKAKTGFGIPIQDWLRNELKPWRDELIHLFLKRNIINKNVIVKLVDDFDDGQNQHTLKIWSIICLEIWFQNFVD